MITQSDMSNIVDAIERIVEQKGEQLRQEFYGAIQQLIHNQQALADMLATHNNPDTMTVLAHEMWQRAVFMEADRIQNQLDSVWDEMKPHVQVQTTQTEPVIPDPQLQRILDEEEEIERKAREANPLIPTEIPTDAHGRCLGCGSDKKSTYFSIQKNGVLGPCDNPWHNA